MAQDQNLNTAHNLIASGTIIKGEINSAVDIRVDGSIEGTIFSKGKVVIGEKGVVNGEIKASNIDIMGNVKGNISSASTLSLKSSGVITGDINTQTLIIEQGAVFNGNCKMGKEPEVAPAAAPAAKEQKKA